MTLKSLAIIPARRTLITLAAVAILLAVACSSDPTSTANNTGEPSAGLQILQPNEVGITPILATTQLRVGSQRVSFLLTTSQSLIKAPSAQVKSVFLGEGPGLGEEKQFDFHLWPYGVRGAYSGELNFDQPGTWRLDIKVDGPDGPAEAELELLIADRVGVPDIGSIPPLGPNKTVHTVSGLEELTTDFSPDPDLYQQTIAEAVISGRPSVIVFASPAFCTSPTCGPQVDTVSELKDIHQGKADFIHVELSETPQEIQGDLSRAVFHKLVDQWGLSSLPHWFNESWTFVLGRDGRIVQRFEGFATLEELDEVLTEQLSQS